LFISCRSSFSFCSPSYHAQTPPIEESMVAAYGSQGPDITQRRKRYPGPDKPTVVRNSFNNGHIVNVSRDLILSDYKKQRSLDSFLPFPCPFPIVATFLREQEPPFVTVE
jgi:hypothetical protein